MQSQYANSAWYLSIPTKRGKKKKQKPKRKYQLWFYFLPFYLNNMRTNLCATVRLLPYNLRVMGSNMKIAHALTGIRLTPSSPFYLNNIFLTNKFQPKQDDNWTFIFKYPSSLRFRNIILGFLFFFFKERKKILSLRKMWTEKLCHLIRVVNWGGG